MIHKQRVGGPKGIQAALRKARPGPQVHNVLLTRQDRRETGRSRGMTTGRVIHQSGSAPA